MQTFRELFANSHGDTFKYEKEPGQESLRRDRRYFKVDTDSERMTQLLSRYWNEYWGKPPIFPESRSAIARICIPIAFSISAIFGISMYISTVFLKFQAAFVIEYNTLPSFYMLRLYQINNILTERLPTGNWQSFSISNLLNPDCRDPEYFYMHSNHVTIKR